MDATVPEPKWLSPSCHGESLVSCVPLQAVVVLPVVEHHEAAKIFSAQECAPGQAPVSVLQLSANDVLCVFRPLLAAVEHERDILTEAVSTQKAFLISDFHPHCGVKTVRVSRRDEGWYLNHSLWPTQQHPDAEREQVPLVVGIMVSRQPRRSFPGCRGQQAF